MRVVLAGGGTGGHVIPALAIARELQSHYGATLLFVGTARGLETRLVPQSGFELRLVEAGMLKNVSLMTRFKTLFALPTAVAEARKVLKAFDPDVVVGVGGYASGPAMVAALHLGLPTVAFEPNAVPGLANRIIGRFVTAAAVHFPETARYFRNPEVTGVPVRPEFFSIPETPPPPPHILVTGGSQGAKAINEAVCGMLPMLAEFAGGLRDVRFIHQTGARDVEMVREAYARSGVAFEAAPYLEDMAGAFARAHVIVCRSGAGTVAEVAAAGRPAIFIPYPHAADDHQRKNAEALSAKGGAVLLPQDSLTPQSLLDALRPLLADAPLWRRMAGAARSCAHPDALARITATIARLAGVQ